MKLFLFLSDVGEVLQYSVDHFVPLFCGTDEQQLLDPPVWKGSYQLWFINVILRCAILEQYSIQVITLHCLCCKQTLYKSFSQGGLVRLRIMCRSSERIYIQGPFDRCVFQFFISQNWWQTKLFGYSLLTLLQRWDDRKSVINLESLVCYHWAILAALLQYRFLV